MIVELLLANEKNITFVSLKRVFAGKEKGLLLSNIFPQAELTGLVKVNSSI